MLDFVGGIPKTTIAAQVQDVLNAEDFSLESFDGLTGFFSSIRESIVNTFKKLMNDHETADMMQPVDIGRLYNRLEEVGMQTLKDEYVFRTPQVAVPMATYVNVLDKNLSELITIQKRLYVPLNQWLAHALTEPSAMEKAWVDRAVQFVDLARMKAEYRKNFETESSTNDSTLVKFMMVYPAVSHLRLVNQKVNELAHTLGSFNLVELKKIETRIVEQIDMLIKELQEEGEPTLLRATSERLTKTLVAVAQESDFLIALLFQANQTIGAWNNTVARLKEKY